MKIVSVVLSLVSTTMVASQFLGSTPMDDTPVLLKVHCVGIELEKATISMGSYAGMVLEETFAMIHPPTVLDDSNLTGLVFHGHGMMYDEEETYLPSNGEIEFGHHTTPAVYSGYWNCHYCPDDASGVAKKAWEAAFASELASSGMKYFANTKSCSIDMGFAPYEPEGNAALGIKCKGIKLTKPTVAEATYAAHALEASYNYVHGHHEDNKTMAHVQFLPKASMELNEIRSQRLGTWYSVWWARLMATITKSGFRKPYDDDLPGYCWNDDIRPPRLTNIGQQKWENEFATYLRDSEFKAFQNVKSCSITVDPTATMTELRAGTKPNGCPNRRLTKMMKKHNAKTIAKEDP